MEKKKAGNAPHMQNSSGKYANQLQRGRNGMQGQQTIDYGS
jgi:hypothetical protein